ncbi:unnamed protein product, partial [Brachionus calyciflorus]
EQRARDERKKQSNSNLNQPSNKPIIRKPSVSKPTNSSLIQTPEHLDPNKLNSPTSSTNLNLTEQKSNSNLKHSSMKSKMEINYKIKVYSSQPIDLTQDCKILKSDDAKIVKALGIDLL